MVTDDRWAGLRAAAEYAQSVTFDNQKQRAVLALLDERDQLIAWLTEMGQRYEVVLAERDQAVALLREAIDDGPNLREWDEVCGSIRAFLAALSDEESP